MSEQVTSKTVVHKPDCSYHTEVVRSDYVCTCGAEHLPSKQGISDSVLREVRASAQPFIESGVATDMGAVCPLLLTNLCTELIELREDNRRYESGRVVLTGEIDRLKMAERLNIETVAKLQQERDELQAQLIIVEKERQWAQERAMRAGLPPRASRSEAQVVLVSPDTLHVSHIFDGEEVVTGDDDGQAWVATFAHPIAARNFIDVMQRAEKHVYAERRQPSTKEAPRKFKIGDCVMWGCNRKGVVQGPADEGTRVLVKWQGTEIVDSIEGAELFPRTCESGDRPPGEKEVRCQKHEGICATHYPKECPGEQPVDIGQLEPIYAVTGDCTSPIVGYRDLNPPRIDDEKEPLRIPEIGEGVVGYANAPGRGVETISPPPGSPQHKPDCVKENARQDGRDRWYMLECDCNAQSENAQ